MESFRHYEPSLHELLNDIPLKLMLVRRQVSPQEFERQMRDVAARLSRAQERT